EYYENSEFACAMSIQRVVVNWTNDGYQSVECHEGENQRDDYGCCRNEDNMRVAKAVGARQDLRNGLERRLVIS
ncbi:hypothetical protein PFISCL1PPCAC_25210, partial [Pristionchus fissidentatus]